MTYNNIFKRVTAVLFVFIFLFAGCKTDKNIDEVKKDDSIKNLDSKTITDNVAYYQNDDPFDVETMYLTVRSGNEADGTNYSWNDINAHSTYYYDDNDLERFKVEATLQVGDETGPLPNQLGYGATTPNATVQIRGKTSSRSAQKSYKISLKKDKGEWNEQRTIILNKHVFDNLRFRNKMTYDIMSKYPELMGSRTKFVHLYVKDLTGGSNEFVDYGLFTQVEQMNKRYLLNHGLDSNGQLYKASMFEFLQYDDLKLTTDETYDKKEFEKILEVKGDEDHTKLLKMLSDLNNYAIPIEETFSKYFDEENYFSWLAFQLVIGNTDIVSQNFYLYSPQNGNKWYFISWDNDGAWDHLSRQKNAFQQGYNYTEGVSNLWGVTLHQRVLKSDKLRQKLLDKIDYYYKELSKDKLEPMFKQYSDFVYPYVYSFPDINFAPTKQSEYQTVLKETLNEVEYNYYMIKESLSHPMPFYFNMPEIVGDKMVYVWENSYDFKGEQLTYSIDVSTDYYFNNTILSQKGLKTPHIEGNALPDGQYFVRISSENESGKTQTMQEQYEDIDGLIHYGVTTFFVENGKVSM